MAKMNVEIDTSEFDIPMEKCVDACKAGVYAGAGVVADALREAIGNIPEDERWWYLADIEDNKISMVSRHLKEEMASALNTTAIKEDSDGYISNYVGIYDGYSSITTKKYKRGLPIQMIANSIESGSSVRKKYPVCRKTVAAVKARAQDAMDEAIRKKLEE